MKKDTGNGGGMVMALVLEEGCSGGRLSRWKVMEA